MIQDIVKRLMGEIKAENVGSLTDEQFAQVQSMVDEKMSQEPPPRVAVIGETGVGKSSTLNVLFNAGRDISHIEACTQEAAPFEVPLANGTLVVWDMPGLGESMEKHDVHQATYREVLKDVDVALLILEAHDRAIELVQQYLALELRPMNPQLADKIVFALNKVDLMPPRNWNMFANVPSPEQQKNIEGRINNVQRHIRAVLPTWRGSVVAYSADYYYNLPQLFLAMLDAAPRGRRWVLANEKALADYLDKLPQGVRAVVQTSATPTAPEERLAEVLDSMTEEQRAELLNSGESVGSFLTRWRRRR